MVGIYKLYFSDPDKFYIGSSVNIKDRIYHHIGKLRNKAHINKHLQSAWNKYGEENFKYDVVEICDLKSKLIDREQYYLDKYSPHYNISKIAYSPDINITPEVLKKRSEGIKKSWTPERKKLYSLLRKGKKLTWIDYTKSKPWSEEAKINNLLQKRKSKKVCKLDENKVKEIKILLSENNTLKSIAKKYNVTPPTISDIRDNITWRNI